jgi:hypothetical protein
MSRGQNAGWVMNTRLIAPTAFSPSPLNDAGAISDCRNRGLFGLYLNQQANVLIRENLN